MPYYHISFPLSEYHLGAVGGLACLGDPVSQYGGRFISRGSTSREVIEESPDKEYSESTARGLAPAGPKPGKVERLGVGPATLHCKTNCCYRHINSKNYNGNSPGKRRACSSGNYDVRESKPKGSFRNDDPCEYQDKYQD